MNKLDFDTGIDDDETTVPPPARNQAGSRRCRQGNSARRRHQADGPGAGVAPARRRGAGLVGGVPASG